MEMIFTRIYGNGNELRSSPFIKINGDYYYERDRHEK